MEKANSLLFFVLLLTTSTSLCVSRATTRSYRSPPSSHAASFFSYGPHISTTLTLAVKAVCDLTDHPESCISAISPFLNSASLGPTTDVDVSFVLRLLIKAGKQRTQFVLPQISKAAGDPATEKTVAMILDGCVDKYGSALEDYDNAMEAVAANGKSSARDFLSAVLTEYDTCGNGDAPGDPTLDPKSTWSVQNKALMDIASNCLALCVLL